MYLDLYMSISIYCIRIYPWIPHFWQEVNVLNYSTKVCPAIANLQCSWIYELAFTNIGVAWSSLSH